jgi:cytochrome c
VAAALAAMALFAAVLLRQHRYTRSRWSVFLAGRPHRGAELFEKKRCVNCHAVNGWGQRRAPDLGAEQPPRSSFNQLVTAMWNCSPRMWTLIQKERIPYPMLTDEEMTHLFAFLYTSRYVDEPGDQTRGTRLFQTKGCVRCHALRGKGAEIGPDLSGVGGIDTPIVWAQAMWNHAPAMEAGMQQLGLSWPKFQGAEMNDLLAYIREVTTGHRREAGLFPADPERGRKLFETKSCVRCHSYQGEGGRAGPDLGPQKELPPTLVGFAGIMWNHSPAMWREMKAQDIPRPSFQGREMADVIAFLYSLHYFEPAGQPQQGKQLFEWRGCSHCHGTRAEGGRQGPPLRRSGVTMTTINLATGLWVHGPEMYRRTQQLKVPWPVLSETDVGHLVAFLNASPEEIR